MSRVPVLWTCLTAAGLIAPAVVTVACSAVSKVDYTECAGDNGICREAFGLGWACGEAGLCQEVEQNKRCKEVYPENLFDDPEEFRDAIIFGSLLDHTPVSGDGRMVNASTLAILEANNSGLTDGRQFGIVHCDYREDAEIDGLKSDESVVELTRHLVDDLGAVAIIGPGYSSIAEAVYKELQKPEHETSTLVISPSATSDALTTIDVRDGDKPGLFWRTAPPDSVLGKALASRMDDGDDGDPAVATATLIFVQDSYGQGLATTLDDNFGGDIELRGFDGDTDPLTAIAAIVSSFEGRAPADGEAVVFIGAEVAQVVAFLNAASGFDYFLDDRTQLFLGDAAYNDAVIEQTSTTEAVMLYDQIRIAFPSVSQKGNYGTFKASYQVRFPGDDPSLASYSAHMYDATWLAVYGTAWAHYQRDGELNGLNLAYGLQQISAPGQEPTPVSSSTWNAIKAEFKAGRAVNVQGASGPLDYDPESEELVSVATNFYGIDAATLKFTDPLE